MSVELGKLELKGIIRRRKKIFVTFFAIVFALCAIIAFVLPPEYKSEVMIVVENQEIPEDYVKSTITTFLSERLELLTKKILSYSKLLDIIKDNHLYPDLASEGAMISQMRKDINLQTIDVSLKDRNAGGRGSATIAFILSYNHKNPEKAKIVADTLANLYIAEDQKARAQQATTTTTFLEKELEELRQKVKLNEEKISRFRAANINQLPGSTSIFTQTIFRIEQDIDSTETRIRTLQEKIVYLKSQIANIDPMVPILTDEGKVANNPNNRLKYLRLQLLRMRANLSDKHPDIIRLKSEIAKLEAQVGETDTTSEKIDRLSLVEKELAELKAKYGDKHPDVVRLSKEAELLKLQISNARQPGTIDTERTDNPGYMNIKAQLIVAESEIKALQNERQKLAVKLEDYQARLERAPFVDEEYNSLTLDYENAKKKFNEVSNKLHSAKIAQEMDTSNRGERFHIDNPANLPDKPEKPKRLLIILMGIVLGFGGGILLAALSEGLDSSVKASDELENLAGVPVLATVSYIDSPAQRKIRRNKLIMVVTSALFALLVTSLIVHWFVMPFGDVWTKFEDRLIEIGVPIERKPNNL